MRPWRSIVLLAFPLLLTRCEAESTTDCINPNSDDPACIRAITEKQVDYSAAVLEMTTDSGSFSFGNVAVNASAEMTVKLNSTGDRSAVLKEISNTALDLVPPIELSGSTCASGAILKKGESCTLTFSFKPTEAILSKDSPLIQYRSENLEDTLVVSKELDGTGTTDGETPTTPVDPNTPRAVLVMEGLPTLRAAPNIIATWGTVIVNSAPYDITFVVKNTGAGAATFTSLTAGGITGLSAPVSIYSSECGTSLAAGAECNVVARYRPTAAGTTAQTAVLNYNDGVEAKTTDGIIEGTAANTAVLTVTGHDFGVKAVNSTTDQALTVTNTGGTTATFGTISTAGLNLTSYLSYVSKTCGATLAPSATCTITVRYNPTATNGYISRTLNLNYTNGSGSATATSTVTGATPAVLTLQEDNPGFLPAADLIDFTDCGVLTVVPRTVLMTNTGGTAATSVSTIPTSGSTGLGLLQPFKFSGTSNCSNSVSRGGSCTFTLTCEPPAVFTAAYDSPQTLQIDYNNGLTTTNVQGLVYYNNVTLR